MTFEPRSLRPACQCRAHLNSEQRLTSGIEYCLPNMHEAPESLISTSKPRETVIIPKQAFPELGSLKTKEGEL